MPPDLLSLISLRKLPKSSSAEAVTLGPSAHLCMGRRIVAYRHWFASRQLGARRQGWPPPAGRGDSARAPRSPRRARSFTSRWPTEALEPRTRAPHVRRRARRLEEAQHDPAGPRWKEPNAWMDTAGGQADATRTATGGDPGLTPTRARRCGEGKEVSIGTN